MNVVTLIGNLASDVELRHVDGGRKVASFLLAVQRTADAADFVPVCAWERQAEACAEHLVKGRRIAVDGRLRSREWEQDGGRRHALEVVARRVEFLSGGPRGDGGGVDEGGGAEVIPLPTASAA